MLYLIDHFSDMPVMSLQVGGQIARLDKPIINPNNLRIVGFYVNGPLHGGKILLTEDIRELGEFSAPGETAAILPNLTIQPIVGVGIIKGSDIHAGSFVETILNLHIVEERLILVGILQFCTG